MPLQSNLQLLKYHYREFLRKTAAYNRSEGGDACAYNYYVERAHVEATFDYSVGKLTTAIKSVKLSEVRASYNARKERAKERLRRAFDAKVSRLNSYLSNTDRSSSASGVEHGTDSQAALRTGGDASTSTVAATNATSSELQQLYGSDGFLRRTVLYLVGNAARTYMTSLNSTRVEGLDTMAAALRRPAGQALITVSNHVAALDDPLVVSVLLPDGTLEQPESVRWTLCASDRCFRYAALVPLFRAGKVLPVVRGGGLTQPGMAAAEERLAAGEWVHIFPEGTRSRDGVSMGAARKGVGRLVASVPPDGPAPLVVPFVHRGMEGVMPRGSVLPAVGQQIDVIVGDPIPVADLLAAARAEHWPADHLHTAVAARVSHGLQDLRRRLDAVRAGEPDPGPQPHALYPAFPEGGAVSSLDQFDPADLALAAELRAARRRAQEGRAARLSAAWERLKFRTALQHRSWATQGHELTAAAAGPQVPVMVTMAKAGGPSVGLEGLGTAGANGVVLGMGPGAGAGLGAGPMVGPWPAFMGGASPYVRQLLGWPQRSGAVVNGNAAGFRG